MKHSKYKAVVLFICVFIGPLPPSLAGAPVANTEKVYTPKTGSSERKAILDTVRKELDTPNRFEVFHMKVKGNWAYFWGNSVIIDGNEKLEDDSVKVLLMRQPNLPTLWQIVDIWTLSRHGTEEEQKSFVTRVDQRRETEKIPKDIFDEAFFQ